MTTAASGSDPVLCNTRPAVPVDRRPAARTRITGAVKPGGATEQQIHPVHSVGRQTLSAWRTPDTGGPSTVAGAPKFFVEPLGVSKWDDTFHHDSRYDVAKTLELYDALYRSVPTRADLEAGTRVAQATANDSDDYLEALEASQGSSVLVDDAAYASGLAESLSPS
jgi:hypothetical protein